MGGIRKTDVLVLGATFTGFGIVLGIKERGGPDILLIEPSGHVGPEFITALRYGENWNGPYRYAVTEAVAEELRCRNALDGAGKVHLPAVHPVICRQLLPHAGSLQWLTRPMRIHRDGDGWEVTVVTPAGIETIRASLVIDTTAAGWKKPSTMAGAANTSGGPRVTGKFLQVSLYDAGRRYAAEELRQVGCLVTEGRFPGEVIWALPLRLDEGWTDARRKVQAEWASRHASLRDWTIAATAKVFDLRVEGGVFPIADRFIRIPSAAYDNPLYAMDAGIAFSETILQQGGAPHHEHRDIASV